MPSTTQQPSMLYTTPTVRPSPAITASRAGSVIADRPAAQFSHSIRPQSPSAGAAFRTHESSVALLQYTAGNLYGQLKRYQNELVAQEAQLLHTRQKIHAATEHIARLDKVIAKGPVPINNNEDHGAFVHRVATQAKKTRSASLQLLLSAEQKHISVLTEVNHEIKDVEAAIRYRQSMRGAGNNQAQNDEHGVQEVKTVQQFLRDVNRGR